MELLGWLNTGSHHTAHSPPPPRVFSRTLWDELESANFAGDDALQKEEEEAGDNTAKGGGEGGRRRHTAKGGLGGEQNMLVNFPKLIV